MRHLGIVIGFMLLVAAALPAQEGKTAAASTPESVAQAFLDTAIQDGLEATGKYFDPAALAEVKEAFSALLALEAKRGGDQLRSALFGPGKTLEQTQALPPEEFYRGLMRFLNMQMGENNITFSGGKVLGVVMEGDDLAHVVSRMQIGIGDQAIDKVELASLRRTETGWTMLLRGEMKQMVEAIQAQVAMADAAEAAEAAPASESTESKPEGAAEP